MDSSTEKLLFVLLGWLMGLLGPAVVDGIRQKREDAKCRAAIISELSTLSQRLILVVYHIQKQRGTVSDEELQWILQKFNSVSKKSENQLVLDGVSAMLKLPLEQRQAYLNSRAEFAGIGVLQKYTVATLEARVGAIHTFKTAEQLQFLEIKMQLSFLDDLVDRSRKYDDMTFTVQGGNHKIVVGNQKKCFDDYEQRARQIVEKIEKLTVKT